MCKHIVFIIYFWKYCSSNYCVNGLKLQICSKYKLIPLSELKYNTDYLLRCQLVIVYPPPPLSIIKVQSFSQSNKARLLYRGVYSSFFLKNPIVFDIILSTYQYTIFSLHYNKPVPSCFFNYYFYKYEWWKFLWEVG